MTLAPQLQALQAREHDYEPSQATKAKVSRKVLTALIAPTAVGKSTLIQHLIRQGGPDFSEAYSVMTRPRRADDPAGYMTHDEGYTLERVVAMIDDGELVNYTVHPSGNIYGSVPESFPARYNFLPTMSSSLLALHRAGFAALHMVYLVVSPDEWKERLRDRQTDAAYQARLSEAIDSLTWAQAHSDELYFIENAAGQLDQAAQAICNIAEGQVPLSQRDYGLARVAEMLAFAQTEQKRA